MIRAREIIRGSHERARRERGRASARTITAVAFLCPVLLRLSSNHVATLRILAANSLLFPVNAPTKSSAGRTPDCGRHNRDDNAVKDGLSWAKVRGFPWIMQIRAGSCTPWNLYKEGSDPSIFWQTIIRSQFYFPVVKLCIHSIISCTWQEISIYENLEIVYLEPRNWVICQENAKCCFLIILHIYVRYSCTFIHRNGWNNWILLHIIHWIRIVQKLFCLICFNIINLF